MLFLDSGWCYSSEARSRFLLRLGGCRLDVNLPRAVCNMSRSVTALSATANSTTIYGYGNVGELLLLKLPICSAFAFLVEPQRLQ